MNKNMDKKRKSIIYSIIGLLAIAVLVFVFSGKDSKKSELSAEDTVKVFHSLIAKGEYDKAYELCDSLAMNGYIENYRNTVNDLQKEDSSAVAIAASMLADAKFELIESKKDGEVRVVKYTLETDGNIKTKIARIETEEGEWKIKAITDAI